MKKIELPRVYTVARTSKTDVDYLLDVEVVEQVKMTWADFVAYVRGNYDLIKADKRYGRADVR